MASSKISDLTAAVAVAAADLLTIVQGGTNKKWAVGTALESLLAGILGAAFGGTGNGFTQFSGPTTSTKTFTLPDASANIVTGSGGTPFSMASLAWVANVDPDSIAGNDGDAIASVASGGTADAFVQSSSSLKPLLKKGVNGVNSHNVIRFDGTNDTLATTTGGASLTGDFYIGAVVRFNGGSGYQNIASWGDSGTTGKRRSLMRFLTTNYVAFVGESADVVSTTAVTNGNTYCLEAIRSGSTTTVYANGVSVASGTPAYVAYSATLLRMGENPASGEPLNGDVAALFLLGSVPSAANLIGIRAYVASRFALTISGSSALVPLAGFSGTATGAIQESTVLQSAAGNVVVNGLAVAVTQGTAVTPNNPAFLTVYGPLAVIATAQEHLFQNSWTAQNVACFQSLDNANGLSAIRYADYLGAERMAQGYGNPGGSGSFPFYGFAFTETSNNGSNSGTPVEYRIITTGAINSLNGNHVRQAYKADGTTVIYKVDANYPSQTDGLAVTANGNVVVGSAALATNATDGFMYMPSGAGTPSGTPTAYTGRVPFYYDSTNDILYIYRGGWKKAAASLVTGAITWV